jgi:hypothetical protein
MTKLMPIVRHRFVKIILLATRRTAIKFPHLLRSFQIQIQKLKKKII